jgi:hypothetical protein
VIEEPFCADQLRRFVGKCRALMRHACITTSAQYVTPPSDLARRAANILPIWDQG